MSPRISVTIHFTFYDIFSFTKISFIKKMNAHTHAINIEAQY